MSITSIRRSKLVHDIDILKEKYKFANKRNLQYSTTALSFFLIEIRIILLFLNAIFVDFQVFEKSYLTKDYYWADTSLQKLK